MKIDYLLTGTIDQQYIELRGSGSIDHTTGEYKMDIEVHHCSDTWDPWFIILMTSDNLRFYTSHLGQAPSYHNYRSTLSGLTFGFAPGSIHPAGPRDSFIGDDKGNVIAALTAKGSLFIKGDKVETRSVLTAGTSQIKRFGGIKAVKLPFSERIVPTGVRRALGVATFQLECNDGTQLHGATYYPYIFNEASQLTSALELTCSHVSVDSSDWKKGGKSVKYVVRNAGVAV